MHVQAQWSSIACDVEVVNGDFLAMPAGQAKSHPGVYLEQNQCLCYKASRQRLSESAALLCSILMI